jgi:hypothetical protein
MNPNLDGENTIEITAFRDRHVTTVNPEGAACHTFSRCVASSFLRIFDNPQGTR